MKLLKFNELTKNGMIYKKGCFKNIPEQVPLFENFNDTKCIGTVEGIREEDDFLVATNLRIDKLLSSTIAPMICGDIEGNTIINCELLSLSFIPDGTHSIDELNNNISENDKKFSKIKNMSHVMEEKYEVKDEKTKS